MPITPPITIPRGSGSARPTPAATSEQTMSQPPPFRLQTRRGSRSAPDPWALGPLSSSSTTANGPDNSSITATAGGATGSSGQASSLSTTASRITIVRVHEDLNSRPDSAVDSAADFSDGTSSSYGATGASARPGRSNSWGSNHSNSGNVSPGRSHSPGGGRRFGGRMTFAFASFTPINPPEKTPSKEQGRPLSQGFSGPSTPITSGSASPTHTYSSQQQAGGHARRRTYSNPNLAPIKPSLTPQQIYELAVSSTASLPPASASAAAELAAFAAGTNSGDASPIHASPSLHRAHSTSRPTTPGLTGLPAATSPAIFRPMPDEIYLPFIDRPAEVTALLNEQPTSRLFHLLEALFPSDMRQSRSAPPEQREEGIEEETTDDPKKWTFERLSDHLMKTTRAQIDDTAWTDAARACIRGRSEALWERFKGALGVPAELEVEDEDGEEDDLDLVENYAESEGAVDLSGDTESLRRNPHSGSAGDLASLGHIVSEREAVIEPVFADQSGSEEDDDVEALDDEEAEAGGEGKAGTGEGIGRHLPDLSTGALSEGGWSSGRVMENIGEGSDEEAEEDHSKAKHGHHHHHHYASHDGHADHPTPSIQTAEFEDSDFAHPQREIRALQITTSPSFTSPPNIPASAPPIGAHGSPRFRTGAPPSLGGDLEDGSDAGRPPLHLAAAHFPQPHLGERVDSPLPNTAGNPALPVQPVKSTTATPPAAATVDNTTPRVVLRRPSESIAQTLSATSPRPTDRASLAGTSASAAGYRGFGGYGLAENVPYHPALSERGPGNPLFPSSFAGLSVGPTLLANVPKASRSATIGHGAHYPSSLSPASRNLSSGGPGSDVNLGGSPSSLRRYASLTESRRAMRSTWQDVRDRHEYAVTVASASSDGGRG